MAEESAHTVKERIATSAWVYEARKQGEKCGSNTMILP